MFGEDFPVHRDYCDTGARRDRAPPPAQRNLWSVGGFARAAGEFFIGHGEDSEARILQTVLAASGSMKPGI